jgi:hypothetical protein
MTGLALVLVALASSGAPAPTVNNVAPLVLGHFETMEACDTAGRAARLAAASTMPRRTHRSIVLMR